METNRLILFENSKKVQNLNSRWCPNFLTWVTWIMTPSCVIGQSLIKLRRYRLCLYSPYRMDMTQ